MKGDDTTKKKKKKRKQKTLSRSVHQRTASFSQCSNFHKASHTETHSDAFPNEALLFVSALWVHLRERSHSNVVFIVVIYDHPLFNALPRNAKLIFFFFCTHYSRIDLSGRESRYSTQTHLQNQVFNLSERPIAFCTSLHSKPCLKTQLSQRRHAYSHLQSHSRHGL